MGAWGSGSFENDDALDWLGEFCDEPGEETISDAFGAVNEIGSEYLEAPECSMALAAAEVVAALKGASSQNLPEAARECFAKLRLNATGDVVATALKAVERIRTDSELKELWEEQDPAEWYAAVDDLAARLKQ